jgi:hypothetical protein
MQCSFVSERAEIRCQLDANHTEWHMAWDGDSNPILKLWKRAE